MLILHEQEKAYNAIKFFIEHTHQCVKKKLYKLLYALDFEHFEKTGRSVTGYTYEAWRMGPVPVELDREIRNKDSELAANFEINEVMYGPYPGLEFKPKTPFEEKWFSRRELKLLKDIADRFVDRTTKEMEDWTHLPNMPWHRVYNEEQNPNGLIPYEYQLSGVDDETKELILEASNERDAIITHYQ